MTFSDSNRPLLHRLEQGVRRLARRRLQGRRLEAGVLVAVTDDLHDPQLILTRRTAHLSSHAGEVAFPGGKRDPEDDDLLATALREAEEEVALDPTTVRVVGPLHQVLSKHGLCVEPWLAVIPKRAPLSPNPDELDCLFRVPLRFFLEDQRMRTDHLQHKGRSLYVPAYEYGENIIWGLTAYVVVEMLNECLGAGIPLRPRPES